MVPAYVTSIRVSDKLKPLHYLNLLGQLSLENILHLPAVGQ